MDDVEVAAVIATVSLADEGQPAADVPADGRHPVSGSVRLGELLPGEQPDHVVHPVPHRLLVAGACLHQPSRYQVLEHVLGRGGWHVEQRGAYPFREVGLVQQAEPVQQLLRLLRQATVGEFEGHTDARALQVEFVEPTSLIGQALHHPADLPVSPRRELRRRDPQRERKAFAQPDQLRRRLRLRAGPLGADHLIEQFGGGLPLEHIDFELGHSGQAQVAGPG